MKKKIAAVGLCFAFGLATLCACNAGGKNNSALSKPNDVYGMGAVSTVKLLGSDTSVRALSKFTAATGFAAQEDSAQSANGVKEQAGKFNEYFTALDSFMSEEIVTTVSEKNTDEAYPFETKLTINGKDVYGEPVRNVMYYTETLIGTETDGDETESNYYLEGVMVVDGLDYRLEGGRSFEQEDGETENEIKIRAYADITDKTSYVEMEQEYSQEEGERETEYVYSIVENGRLVEQTAVEFETENKGNKEEVEYELEFRKGEARGKYEIERETQNGSVCMKVKYNLDGKRGVFRIRQTTDSSGEKHYEYTFEDNSKLTF